MTDEPTTQPATARPAWLRTVLLMAIPLALAWAAAFWVTGMLWWRAPDTAAQATEVPPAAQVHAADSDWVDIEMYRRSNPQWRP